MVSYKITNGKIERREVHRPRTYKAIVMISGFLWVLWL